MPMELYSTESAFLLSKRVVEEPPPGVSVGYYEVVLATALVSLVWFLLDLARKHGLTEVFPRFKILSRESHKQDIWHLHHSSAPVDDSASFSSNGGSVSISTKPWKLSIPKLPVLTNSVTMSQIRKWFPGAIVTQDLVLNIKDALEPYGYGETSLIATSLCSDEVNRPLEKDLFEVYERTFSMGGLSGVPFGGVTAFGAMAHHIPDGGSCLIVYGPHVGIDKDGNLGTVNRRGRSHGGACCGSAIAACHHVKALLEQGDKKTKIPHDVTDAQQTFVQNMLLPYGNRLQFSEEPMAELPYAMYDAQTELIEKIVQKGCGQVAGEGKIALLGGIQINTPKGMSDYFLPLRFDIFDNKGAVVANLKRGPPRAPISKIALTFPRALPNAKLIEKVQTSLAPFGYGKNSLLCTSLCCDEVNRPLEHELWDAFGEHFNLGGLAGTVLQLQIFHIFNELSFIRHLPVSIIFGQAFPLVVPQPLLPWHITSRMAATVLLSTVLMSVLTAKETLVPSIAEDARTEAPAVGAAWPLPSTSKPSQKARKRPTCPSIRSTRNRPTWETCSCRMPINLLRPKIPWWNCPFRSFKRRTSSCKRLWSASAI